MGLFNSIFSKKEKDLAPLDYKSIGVDMHSHFIPGIDDGAKTLRDSMEMIKEFQALGYRKVITTPHIMSDHYRNTPEIIQEGEAVVKAEITRQGINIEFQAAAEYFLDESFMEQIQSGTLLTFGKKHVLFEMSFFNESPSLKDAIFKMQMQGYKPILAHPERYSYWYKDLTKYQDLKDRGVLFQMNIGSIIGAYSDETKKIAEWLINQNMINLIGSDCHKIEHTDYLRAAAVKPYMHKLYTSGALINHTL